MREISEPTERQLREQAAGLRAELDRYRAATQDALEQLDWCIGYFTGKKMPGIAGRLSTNRAHIRTNLLQRAEQPLPRPVATGRGEGA